MDQDHLSPAIVWFSVYHHRQNYSLFALVVREFFVLMLKTLPQYLCFACMTPQKMACQNSPQSNVVFRAWDENKIEQYLVCGLCFSVICFSPANENIELVLPSCLFPYQLHAVLLALHIYSLPILWPRPVQHSMKQ